MSHLQDKDAQKDEGDIERVLRAAGARINPSQGVSDAVRAVVRSEWRATVERHRQHRRRVWLAAAAAVALVVVGSTVSLALLSRPGEVVASVSRSFGTVTARPGFWPDFWPRSVPTLQGQQLRAGQIVSTGEDGRIALRLPAGLSVRLDRGTTIELADAEHIAIRRGAVYVDAGMSPLNPLRIDTPAGSVRHLGTQYEVRLVAGDTRVRVREGRVEMKSSDGIAIDARAGEQLLLSPSGAVQRSSIVKYGMDWAWTSNAAPPFDTNGRSLQEFLAWVGRELGHEIVFATPQSEAEATRTVLSGSVLDLSPAEALAAVLPTTRLRSATRNGQIVVDIEDTAR